MLSFNIQPMSFLQTWNYLDYFVNYTIAEVVVKLFSYAVSPTMNNKFDIIYVTTFPIFMGFEGMRQSSSRKLST